MDNSPYSRYSKEELRLRDLLSVDRTILSNERNLLAYIRTALAVLVAGVTLIHFFESHILRVFGWTFIPVGIGILLVGFQRYRKVKQSIERFRKATDTE